MSKNTAALALTVLLASAVGSATAADVAREATTLNLGDFTTKAEWTYPAGTQGHLPAVLLIHGSSPADMNFTMFNSDKTLKSQIFLDIANGLSSRGIAVLRYNKHYVTGPGEVNYQDFYAKADLSTFLKDAETALDAVKRNPRVDPKRIFVYGWSEGSTVAAALVKNHPEVAGLMVQGPVVLPWADLFDKQLTDVQLPYLKQLVPGGLTNQNLMQVMSGKGGMVAQNAPFFVLDPAGIQTGKYSLNAAADTNKDGKIELDSEYLPGAREALKYLITAPDGYLNMYSPARALPSVTAQVPSIKMPMLVLQGMNDASTPEPYLMTLQTALQNNRGSRATIKRYPGLGHSLGLASSMIEDDFAPIQPQPIQDAADWILKR